MKKNGKGLEWLATDRKDFDVFEKGNKCVDLFTACMDEEGIEYQKTEDGIVCAICKWKNLPLIPVWFFFHEDEMTLVEIKCWDIAHVKKEKRMTAYRVCNEMNRKYRLVSFCLNEEDDIVLQIDHFVADKEGFGEFCVALLWQALDIIDAAYPHFAKALLGKRV